MQALNSGLSGGGGDFIRDAFTHWGIHERTMILAGNDFDDCI
jgi:hypothetical protein